MIGYSNVKQFMTISESYSLDYYGNADNFDMLFRGIADKIFKRTSDENLLMEITIEEYE